jgi:hypothetical protein
MILVAIGCGRLPAILEISEKQSIVVFGTMGDKPLLGLSDGNRCLPVYFYETG